MSAQRQLRVRGISRRDACGALDEEQRKFREFLDGLRKSKDKEEFDRFMADRRARRTNEGPQGAGA